MALPYQSYMSLRHDAKGVPYGGSPQTREDGGANHGFKDLKGDPQLVDAVPELKVNAPLKSLITALSRRECGLFTVGCEVGEVVEAQGNRYSGYVEFAINSASEVQDATNYFPLFFRFDRLLLENRFANRVQLNWELQPALFGVANVKGFTCSIFVNTHFHDSLDSAHQCWAATLGLLEQFLSSAPARWKDPLY